MGVGLEHGFLDIASSVVFVAGHHPFQGVVVQLVLVSERLVGPVLAPNAPASAPAAAPESFACFAFFGQLLSPLSFGRILLVILNLPGMFRREVFLKRQS
jgi:hypothetical protein